MVQTRIADTPETVVNVSPRPFGMNSGDKSVVESIARWCHTRINYENWTPEEYKRAFGSRTPREIVDSGKTGFVGSCLDMTIVANAALMDAGFKTTIVVDETMEHEHNLVRPHFAVEFDIGGEPFHLDFHNMRKTFFSRGRYTQNKKQGVKSLHVHRFGGKLVGWDDKPMKALLGIESMDGINGKMKHFYQAEFKRGIEQIRADKNKIDDLFRNHGAILPELILDGVA
jgi:hypothetical protein